MAYIMAHFIRLHVDSLEEYPIRTKISLRPTEDSPFPAVIVDLSEMPDPMGYIKKSGNMVTWDQLPQKGV